MFVKVTPHLHQRIASNIGVLEDKKDPVDGHYYKVKQQLPDATLGARVHYNKVVQGVQDRNKDRLEGAPRETWYFQGTHLYVNGRRVRDPITPPLWSLLLTISSDHQKVLDNIALEEQAYKESDGSRFYGYAIRAYELQTIEKVYTRLRQQHVAADHVVLGYRINYPDSPQECLEGSCHDGESQGDVILAQVLAETRMSNVVVFVVHYSGANPLRAARLQLLGDCAKSAIHALQYPDGEPGQSSPTDGEEDTSSTPKTPSTSPKRPMITVLDHGYGRHYPQKLSGRGGMSSSIGRQLCLQEHQKRPHLDFAATMAYTLE